MGIFYIFLLSVIAFISGVIFILVLEFYIFKKYFEEAPKASLPEHLTIPSPVQLPEELVNQIKEQRANLNTSSAPHQNISQANENLAINLTLQFIFNELRNAERVRRWLYRKLNNEFKELLNQSSTGKLFDSVQLRDLDLGNHFPTIKALDVAEAKICADTGLIETLDLCIDLQYSGNFQMSMDVKLLLGKTAYLSVQIKKLNGKARLQFTRAPYTHWSLSFYTEPILDLEVQSQFQGRQLQPQIVSLITNQIRKAVRRKHTLPRYKIRYKPFFRRLNHEDIDLSEVSVAHLLPGVLDVTLLEVSRLNIDLSTMNVSNPSEIEIFCTISIDSTPWVCLTQYGDIAYMVLDLIISKISNQHLGVVFKQENIAEIGQNCVIVETIVSGSPAAIAEMKRGDIIYAVNGKKIANINQLAKVLRNAGQRRFIIRVERRYTSIDSERHSLTKLDVEKSFDKSISAKRLSVNKLDALTVDDSVKSMKFSDIKDFELENFEKSDSSNKLFKRRKSSSVYMSSEDSFQMSETPLRRISTASTTSSISNSGNFFTSTGDVNSFNLSDYYYTSKDKEFASLITFEEKQSFSIDSENQYLNIGVWAKAKGESHKKLLGYINSPIKLILTQCSAFTTGYGLKCHALLPPDSTTPDPTTFKLHGYSGFDPSLCYGDILLSYVWVSHRSNNPNLDYVKKNEESVKTQPVATDDHANRKQHDFIRTHFHRATHCDFCTKKIWLKDAVQCRNCGMVCHKKCEVRCQATNSCGAEYTAGMAFEADDVETGPEISLTNYEENAQGPSMTAMKATITNTLLGLKKAGSTSCLAPPNAGIGLASRSLPPSPCASRKVEPDDASKLPHKRKQPRSREGFNS